MTTMIFGIILVYFFLRSLQTLLGRMLVLSLVHIVPEPIINFLARYFITVPHSDSLRESGPLRFKW